MGCVDCGGDNNWANCDALEIEKGTNRLPKKFIIQSRAEVAPNGNGHSLGAIAQATVSAGER
jgi:hypothetical protein